MQDNIKTLAQKQSHLFHISRDLWFCVLEAAISKFETISLRGRAMLNMTFLSAA
jgi:hypothetical protein